jgi:hypothetical protein
MPKTKSKNSYFIGFFAQNGARSTAKNHEAECKICFSRNPHHGCPGRAHSFQLRRRRRRIFIVAAGLILLELRQLLYQLMAAKIVILAVNVAMDVYLMVRVRTHK